jgi:hypothetical protein
MIGIEVSTDHDPLGRRCVLIQVSRADGDFWITLLPDDAQVFAAQVMAEARFGE